MNDVRYSAGQITQELCCNHLAGSAMEFSESEFGGSVYGHEEVELAFGCLHLYDIDVEIANRVIFGFLSGWLVTLYLR